MADRMCWLYRVVHRDSGRGYIGIAVNPKKRWLHHRWSALRNNSATLFHRALRKYGRDAFDWTLIGRSSVDGCKRLEQFAIVMGLGQFNLTKGGDGTIGWHHSAESARKISESNKGRKRLVGARTGSIASPETRAKMSQSAKKRPRKPCSEETKAKISAATVGKKRSAEFTDACRKRQTGKQMSEQTKLRMSQASAARKHTEEAKQNMREAWKLRKAASDVQ